MATLSQSVQHKTHAGTLSWLALVTVWFVWGSTYLGIRVAVQTIPPFLMAGTRYLIAGSLLAAIIWFAQGKNRKPIGREELISVALSAILLLVVGNGLLSYGEVRLASGVAALIVATVPIWMLVIDAVLSRSIRPGAVVGIVVGTLGIVALVGTPSAHVSFTDTVLVTIGSFSWAAGSVITRRRSSEQLNPMLPALEMAMAGAVMCVIAFATGEWSTFCLACVSKASIAGYLYLIVIGAMVAYSAYGYAVRTLPTNVVATYAYVNPIVAVLLGSIVLKEPLTLNVLLGGAAIVVAVVSIMLSNRETARA